MDDLTKNVERLSCLDGIVEGLNQLAPNDVGAKLIWADVNA
jgi:hypothetical protein